jgi:UDP-N-acetylmuramyl pentapeptide phosphotransferase/UDP-N-acetylglucosamine-1-phosphate transferase
MDVSNIVKVITPAVTAFAVGIAITPILTHYLYKYKAWKKKPGKVALDGKDAIEFNKLHELSDTEKHTPRMGGIVIWGSAVITIFLISLFAHRPRKARFPEPRTDMDTAHDAPCRCCRRVRE